MALWSTQPQDSESPCSHGVMVLIFQTAGDSFYWDIYGKPYSPVLTFLGQSLTIGGMGYLVKKSILKIGDPVYMRKALVNNLAEEKRTVLHIQKLQKALNDRFREIDKEKAALRTFLIKLHKTTGYFPQLHFWWPVPLEVKSPWKSINTEHICVPCYLCVSQESSTRNHWDKVEKKDHTIEDPSGMSIRESADLLQKRKQGLFPDEPLTLLNLQLEVVTCSAYATSIQTSLETRIKLSYCRDLSYIDCGMHHIFAFCSFLTDTIFIVFL